MSAPTVAVALCLSLAAPAIAQSPNPYNGSWVLTFDGSRTPDLEGTVVIDREGGTWKVVATARKNPCIGREAPITVQVASADELVFEVNRSKVLTGCKDWTMRFKKTGDKTLQAEFTDGRLVTLTRQ